MHLKKTAAGVAVSLIALSSPGLAANNPYVDVPKDNWSYSSIQQLFSDGVLNQEDQVVYANRTLTRYDMAVLTAKALGKEAKATPEQQVMIEKLKKEYTSELQSMGILDKAAEKKEDTGVKVKFYGLTSIKIDSFRRSWDNANTVNCFHMDLYTQIQATPQTSVTIQHAFNKGFANQWESDAQNSWAYAAWADTKVGTTEIKLGRFPYMPGFGLVYNDRINGGQITAKKNKVAATVTFGRNQSYAVSESDQVHDLSGSSVHPENYAIDGQRHYNALELKYSFDKKSTAKMVFQTWKNGSHYWEMGAVREFNDKWKGTVAFAKSNVDTGDTGSNKSYYARIQYRPNLNVFKPGDYTLYAAWLKVPKDATICPINQYDLDYTYNFKGWVVGTEIVVRPRETISLWLMRGTKANSYRMTNVFRFEYNFLMF